MASYNPQKSFFDKQQGKRSMESSLPPVPMKSRTKVQVSKATPDVRIKNKSSKTQTTEALCHKRSGREVYDDKVGEPIKDPSDEPTRSSSGLLSDDLKSYLEELVGMLLAHN
ncbi:hypothetical protein RYX36_016607 [Vicia faba]